jgi:acyl-[acyl-carrier-protein] desaturase
MSNEIIPREVRVEGHVDEHERSGQSVQLLSKAERYRCLERAFSTLYRWYVSQSQERRNWNPDMSFDWRKMRHDHTDDVMTILDGFFAVEQFVPDYTSKIVDLVRRSHGRSHFQLRWGGEEARHADSWENALLFSRRRSVKWIEEYKIALRQKTWTLPWEDPLHMLTYTVFQERATQLNYLNLARILRDPTEPGGPTADVDPVLAAVSTTLATDEASHYTFFLEGLRLYLYYFPEESLQSILDVIRQFAMPAQDIIPNWDKVAEAIYRNGIYSPKDYTANVVAVVFENLGIENRRKVEAGLKASRNVPDPDGNIRGTAIWDCFDAGKIKTSVGKMHKRLEDYEIGMGRAELDPLVFVPNPDFPSRLG